MTSLRTLHQAFDQAAATASGYWFTTHESERWRSYAALRDSSLQLARSLRDAGFRRGDLVALLLPDAEQFLVALLGTSYSGATPASLAPPATTVGLPRYVERTLAILRSSEARAVVTTRRIAAELVTALAAARSAFAHQPMVLIVDDLDATAIEPDLAPSLDEVALVQFTSGSTASPKGVTLTHANIAANIEAFGGPQGIAISGDDIGVSWLPLSHDMGLVGMAFGALYAARPCALLPPQEFVKRPAAWLRAITRYRATVSFAPNFAYELCARRIGDTAELDLSSWRVAGCGAEPIHADTLAAFAGKFSPAGFRETAFVPCYGLAEHVLAATVSPRERCPRIERVSAGALSEGKACRAGDGEPSVALVGCGRSLPGHRLRIVGDAARVLDERMVGEIQLAGPSVMRGYHHEPALNAETIRDGWLCTGDLGFLSEDELFVCGRAKDVVIVHGRKFQSEDLEWAVEHVRGVRPGRAVAFGASGEGSERLVVVVERDGTVGPAVLAEAIRREVADVFGLAVDDIVVADSGTIDRTTSGKNQRAAMRSRYESGALGDPFSA
jgi:acyl-CoA synthetase (AMP-forming)/AMP-acid ligase II